MPKLVKANGYKHVFSVVESFHLTNQLEDFLRNEGPSFLEVKVKPGSRDNLGRPTIKPIDNKKAFMDFLKG